MNIAEFFKKHPSLFYLKIVLNNWSERKDKLFDIYKSTEYSSASRAKAMKLFIEMSVRVVQLGLIFHLSGYPIPPKASSFKQGGITSKNDGMGEEVIINSPTTS